MHLFWRLPLLGTVLEAAVVLAIRISTMASGVAQAPLLIAAALIGVALALAMALYHPLPANS